MIRTDWICKVVGAAVGPQGVSEGIIETVTDVVYGNCTGTSCWKITSVTVC